MVNRGFYRSSPTVEMVTEAITKANEPLANSRQQPHLVVGSRVFLTPSGTVPIMFHLAMPCFLIKLVLSLLFNKNQSDESDKVELSRTQKAQDIETTGAKGIPLKIDII